MVARDPYQVVQSVYVTEKAQILQDLKNRQSNASVRKCESPKYVFVVAAEANKHEIAWAVQEIYKDKNIKVAKVNTLRAKPKPKRKGRGREGETSAFKKAIVTLQKGDVITELEPESV